MEIVIRVVVCPNSVSAVHRTVDLNAYGTQNAPTIWLALIDTAKILVRVAFAA